MALKLAALVASCALVGFIAYAIVIASSGKPPGATFPSSSPRLVARGTLAPSFALPRLGAKGRIDLAELRGRPVVMNFFASWCVDCRVELRALAELARAQAGRVEVVGIDDEDSNPGLASRLLSDAHASYPVGSDPNGNVASTYLVSALPVTFFIDAKGRIVGELYGAQTLSSFERAVDGLTRSVHPR